MCTAKSYERSWLNPPKTCAPVATVRPADFSRLAERNFRNDDATTCPRNSMDNYMSLAIESHDLTRYFDDFKAVDAIDLRVERGTFYGFLGPNGAGKSTTIKMLTGLLAPSHGEIRVLGKNMLDPKEALEAKRRVGVI